MTYTMITTTETATEVRTETNRRLAEGDVQMIREAARVIAEPGDTITHRVIPE